MSDAIILLAHGSRDPLWRAPVEAVAARLRALSPKVAVACAYLELCEPPLAQAVAELADAGVRSVAIVPLFLGMGRHVREDLPQLVEALRKERPGVHLSLGQPVGEDARVTELLARIALECASPL